MNVKSFIAALSVAGFIAAGPLATAADAHARAHTLAPAKVKMHHHHHHHVKKKPAHKHAAKPTPKQHAHKHAAKPAHHHGHKVVIKAAMAKKPAPGMCGTFKYYKAGKCIDKR